MPDNWFVVVMGIGVVFAVLVLIIGMCWLVGLLCRDRKEEEATPAPAAPAAPAAIANRGALAAAVAAAVVIIVITARIIACSNGGVAVTHQNDNRHSHSTCLKLTGWNHGVGFQKLLSRFVDTALNVSTAAY